MTDPLLSWLREQLAAIEADENKRLILTADPDKPCPWCNKRVTGVTSSGHDQPERLEPCGCQLAHEDFLAWAEAKPAPDPAVLRDVAAKRAILDAYEEADRSWRAHHDRLDEGEASGLWAAVRLLASAYSHRPGYRKEWE